MRSGPSVTVFGFAPKHGAEPRKTAMLNSRGTKE